jgi:hypothetical protein
MASGADEEAVSDISSTMTTNDVFASSAYQQNANYSEATAKLLKEYASAFGVDKEKLDEIMSSMSTQEIFVDSALQQVALYEQTSSKILYLILETLILNNTIG